MLSCCRILLKQVIEDMAGGSDQKFKQQGIFCEGGELAMSQFGVILALIFSLVIAIFALANNQLIIVNYLYGKTEISAVIVILGAAILGAFVMFLLNMFKQIKTSFHMRSLQSELGESRSQIDELKSERDALLVQLGQLQDSFVNPEESGKVEKPSPDNKEPYVTGLYMSQEETEVKEDSPAGDEHGQMDPARDEEETTPDPVVEAEPEKRETHTDKKDEKEL